jgi:GWxTD domain-containing protein
MGALLALGPALLVLGLAAVTSCRLYNLERKLAPAHADFLDKAGYIVTNEERKIFLELPESERDGFIEEFWRRRDAEPDTAVNEYRMEYEDRVKRAGLLFHGEGRPGWRTDRGRIYILFGPPSERLTYPVEASGHCREIWYYGTFPVVFDDERCDGNYILTPVDLQNLQELNIAQGYFQKTFTQQKRFFDYNVSVLKVRAGDGEYEGKVFVDIPYGTIWFTFKEERLETAFVVRLELSDGSGERLWDALDSFPLTLTEAELRENRSRTFRMEFPFLLRTGLEGLRDRTLRLEVSVKNTTEGEELRKAVEFRLKFGPSPDSGKSLSLAWLGMCL